MKNAMLNAIPKAQFQRMVIEATNVFRKIHAEGNMVVGTVSGDDKISGIKSAIADSSIGKDLKTAFLNLISVAIGEAVATAPRNPTADELAKQRLTFIPFAAVVPLRNRNHHAYNIGEAVIMVHGASGADHDMFGLDKRGCIISKSTTASDGLSHLPRYRKSLRPATNYEIMGLIDALYS
jgi:hypothetical protein